MEHIKEDEFENSNDENSVDEDGRKPSEEEDEDAELESADDETDPDEEEEGDEHEWSEDDGDGDDDADWADDEDSEDSDEEEDGEELDAAEAFEEADQDLAAEGENSFGEAVAEEENLSADEANEGDDVDVIHADMVVTNVADVISEAEVIEHQADAAAELIKSAMGMNAAEEEAPFARVSHDPGIEEEAEEPAPRISAEMAELMPFRELDGADLQAAVEATFFMHHKPITISRLRDLINPKIKEDEYRTAVSNLMASYWDDSKGIELAEVAGGYQFRTKELHKDIMRRMYQIAPMKLTNAMLEVLAISAYNQPITREGIDRVRGVDSSHLVRVLLDKKMLRIVGKSDELGRPMLYGTTKEFLEVFGLRDLAALPSLRDIEEMLPKNEVGAEISEEEALAKEMEGIVENSKPLEFNDLELEELEHHETQKISGSEAASPETHSNGRETPNGSPQEHEAGGEDFHLENEASGRFPLGPEGHA